MQILAVWSWEKWDLGHVKFWIPRPLKQPEVGLVVEEEVDPRRVATQRLVSHRVRRFSICF